MVKFFRHIRQRMLKENRFSRYLLYAIGEIVLVMIGILLALQVNNWNEQRKERLREVKFLNGLKDDLAADRSILEYVMKERTAKVFSANALLNPIPLDSYQQVFAADSMLWRLMGWVEYVPQTNTFDELVSSGNLHLLKNDSIKSMLLDLKRMHERDHTYTAHMRREFDNYLYDRHSILRLGGTFLDREATFEADSLIRRVQTDEEIKGLAEQTKAFLSDQQVKNGLRLASGNNYGLLRGCRKMFAADSALIALIDKDLHP